MRIMIDTNILVSSALFPESQTSRALFASMQEHSLVICTYVLEEVQAVFMRKFPHKVSQLDILLSKLAYDLCYTPSIIASTPEMRDENDRPILQAAIDAEVDAILTGDKDFHALDIKHPKIISPSYFS